MIFNSLRHFAAPCRRFVRTLSAPPLACVFDKDGTLLDCHLTWAPIIRDACAHMGEADEHLYTVLGFDVSTGRFVDGSLFMTGTNAEVYDELAEHGVDTHSFQAALKAATAKARHMPLADTKALFTDVRALGLSVAVLTSDDRVNARAFLTSSLGADDVEVDSIPMVCGDDSYGHKPSAEPLLALAEMLGVPPHRMVVVGDTTVDIQCARAAGATSVAVLTGVGTSSSLTDADAVLPSVKDLPALLTRWCSTAQLNSQ